MFESEVKWFNIHADKDNVGATDFLDILHKQIDNAIDGAKNIDVRISLVISAIWLFSLLI